MTVDKRRRTGKTARDRANDQHRKAADNRAANGRYTADCDGNNPKYIVIAPSREGIRNNGKRSRALVQS